MTTRAQVAQTLPCSSFRYDSILQISFKVNIRIRLRCVFKLAALFVRYHRKTAKARPSNYFPTLSYNEALTVSDLQSLQNRRIMACERFITSLKPDNPVYKLVSSRTVDTQYNCSLRLS